MIGMAADTSAILHFIREQFVSRASAERRLSTIRFFREPVDPYGLPVPQVRDVVRLAFPQIKPLPTPDRNALCTDLMKSGRLEESIAAAYIYKRFARSCGPAEFRLFAGWAQRYLKDWASTDTLCCNPVAACIANHPQLAPELLDWAESKSLWKRRAAAVSLIREASAGRLNTVIFAVADRLIADPEVMVQKGVGWLLKRKLPQAPRRNRRIPPAPPRLHHPPPPSLRRRKDDRTRPSESTRQMTFEQELREKLRRIEALYAGATTHGEKLAAAAAMERIRKRLNETERVEQPTEYKFTLSDAWSRKLFVALCRRYGLSPYRYKRQRFTTVMVRVPKSFVDRTLWPEYQEIHRALDHYLQQATDNIIREEVFGDTGEASER